MAQSKAFGYMRIEHGSTAAQSDILRQEMAKFVSGKGFMLTEVFVETDDSASSAFAAMIEALRASKVTTVVVPSMRHLAHMQGVGVAMMELIQSEAGANVLAVTAPADATNEQE